MAVLLHDRPEAVGQKQREALRLPRTSAVVALFAFSSRMDRDSMRLFARIISNTPSLRMPCAYSFTPANSIPSAYTSPTSMINPGVAAPMSR